MEKFPLSLDGKTSVVNLISRKSLPPFLNQPSADVLQNRCSKKSFNIHKKAAALESKLSLRRPFSYFVYFNPSKKRPNTCFKADNMLHHKTT